MIPHSAAYVVLVANMALWGGALVVARGIHELAPPMALTFWRWVVAVLVLLPFVARKLRQELPLKPQARRSIYWICVTMAAGTTLSVVAVNFTTAINATVINATQPALTALAAFLLVRERLFPLQTLGVVLAFLGVIVMVSQASLGTLLQMDINIGDLVMLGAAICWSLYSVEMHRSTHLPSSDVLVFLIACTGIALSFPLYLIEASYFRSFQLTPVTLSAVSYLGIGSTVLAVYLWNAAIRSVGANRAAVFLNLIPVFGATFAIIFLGERILAYHVIGGLLIVIGIFFAVHRAHHRSVPPLSAEEKT